MADHIVSVFVLLASILHTNKNTKHSSPLPLPFLFSSTSFLLFQTLLPFFHFMDSTKPEVSHEVPPYLRVYKDGAVERLLGNEVVPASFDPQTGVLSEDVVVVPDTGVSARLYRPSSAPDRRKLPLLLYFHGGAFCISSAADPMYHRSLNALVAEAGVVAVSVDYRLAPENPLPAAYEDSWAALQWVAGDLGRDAWLREYADFDRVFLAGDSAGANIAHHLALRVADPGRVGGLKIHGVILIHPYFWGEEPIGVEVEDPARKAMVDKWWGFVCPSERGNEDPMINPFADGAPSLARLGCDRALVCVAERDILSDRGRLYYESLVKSGWGGTAEMVATPGEDHVFYIFDPNCEKALDLFKRLASFINQSK